MCLVFSELPHLYTATEDINVFKIVRIGYNGDIHAYFQNFTYKVWKEYFENMENIVHDVCNTYILNKAFHSYGLDITTRMLDNFALSIAPKSYDNRFTYLIDNGLNFALFIIPKGSHYYMVDNMYASDKIIFTGIVRTITDNYSKDLVLKQFKNLCNVFDIQK